ncbi:MAG: Calx-beta domain-containing protein, partial [Burkholderiales bacterium]
AAGNFAQWTVALGSAMPVVGSLALSFGSGTATAGADFTNALAFSTNGGASWTAYSSAVAIPANTTSLLVRAAILDDSVYEASESVVLNATLSATGRTSSTGTGSVTITETDLPGLNISGNSVAEGGYAQWTVALGSAMPVAGSLSLGFGSGTATAGSDFTNALQVSTNGGSTWTAYSSALSIPANTTSLLVRAATIENTRFEGNETIVLNATLSATGRTSSTGTGTATILDDDLPGLNISGNSVAEGGYAQWTVALGSAMPVAGSLSLGFGSGTATAGSDFTNALQVSTNGGTTWTAYSSAVAIPANTTSLLVRAATIENTRFEGNETIVLNATLSATGRTSSTGTGTATILDDDLPGLCVTGNSVLEGGCAQWTVSLGDAMPVAGYVTLGLGAGTANAADLQYPQWQEVSTDGGRSWNWYYNGTNIAIAAGTRSLLVRTPTNEDCAIENDETVVLQATLSASGRTASSASGAAVILNDDVVGASINNISVREAGGSGQQNPDENDCTKATFTVSLSQATNRDVVIAWETREGTATDITTGTNWHGNGGRDFISDAGTVTIRAGQTTATITILVTPDNRSEQAEQFSVVLTSATNARISDSTGVCTIQANVSPLVLDLDGDGVETISASAGVWFDNDASGTARKVGWAGADDGLLVRDLNEDGRINDGAELFGTGTSDGRGGKSEHGFAALGLLDDNHDGLIDNRDAAWKELQVWKDADSDGVTDQGELISLAALGIRSLSLQHETSDAVQNGNQMLLQGQYTDASGARREMTDVFWGIADEDGATELVPVSRAMGAAESLADAGARVWAPGAGDGNVLIRGFDAEHDVIDLRGILPDETSDLGSLLSLRRDGNTTVIDMHAAGGADDRQIVLAGVDLLGERSASEALDDLLRKQQLMTA